MGANPGPATFPSHLKLQSNEIMNNFSSILSNIKTLSFIIYVIIFFIFGAILVYLLNYYSEYSNLLDFWKTTPIPFNFPEVDSVNFDKKETVLKFIILSFFVGLLLYLISLIIFRFYYKLKPPKGDNDKEYTDIDFIIFRQKNPLVAETHTLMDWFSLNVRLLFGIFLILFISFLPKLFVSFYHFLLFLLLSISIYLIFRLGISADSRMRDFDSQIKKHIPK